MQIFSGASHRTASSAQGGLRTGCVRSEDTKPISARVAASTNAPSAETTVSAAVQMPVIVPPQRMPDMSMSVTIVSASIGHCSI